MRCHRFWNLFHCVEVLANLFERKHNNRSTNADDRMDWPEFERAVGRDVLKDSLEEILKNTLLLLRK